jgi:hypothetical protein
MTLLDVKAPAPVPNFGALVLTVTPVGVSVCPTSSVNEVEPLAPSK